MPLPSALDACKVDLFSSDEDLRQKYPVAFAERVMRIRDMYNYWLANPSMKDRQLRDQIMSRYDVSQSCAYSDIAIIHQLAPLAVALNVSIPARVPIVAGSLSMVLSI